MHEPRQEVSSTDSQIFALSVCRQQHRGLFAHHDSQRTVDRGTCMGGRTEVLLVRSSAVLMHAPTAERIVASDVYTHSPARITGSESPVALTPPTSMRFDPIIQSTWIRLVFAPRAASCS
jgi:hypothetical protein